MHVLSISLLFVSFSFITSLKDLPSQETCSKKAFKKFIPRSCSFNSDQNECLFFCKVMQSNKFSSLFSIFFSLFVKDGEVALKCFLLFYLYMFHVSKVILV
jgi:hypothetical protein